VFIVRLKNDRRGIEATDALSSRRRRLLIGFMVLRRDDPLSLVFTRALKYVRASAAERAMLDRLERMSAGIGRGARWAPSRPRCRTSSEVARLRLRGGLPVQPVDARRVQRLVAPGERLVALAMARHQMIW
jgi:hypothetical protein